jgi:hypothetical protein
MPELPRAASKEGGRYAMIHFISRYFYQAQRDKVQMMTRAERRAMLSICFVILCITIILILWLLS